MKRHLDIMMKNLKKYLQQLFPLIIKQDKSNLTIGLSKRFFLFTAMNRLINVIEEDPHLNFIALIKSYKILGRILNGTIHEFYRDRNKIYFKNFFYDMELYELVKKDLERLYPKYKDVQMTITKRGVLVYDNYKKNQFNVLLMTIHSGVWIPKEIDEKLSITKEKRLLEEDIDTNWLYNKLVLDKGGIWIDNKQSRFVVDFNRPLSKAIYANDSEKWLHVVWKKDLNKKEREDILASYREFYFTLARLLESYNFNIIFDGHSMIDKTSRPNISFGTEYIPKFYFPIVKGMQNKMIKMGYSPVHLNNPYKGGFILKWMNNLYPNLFIFSMEVNKKIYMSKKHNKSVKKKLNKISNDLKSIFDIELGEDDG